jgi:8-oxo-dGTP diphosphatase
LSTNRSSLPEISAQTKKTWSPIRHDYSAGGVAYRRLEPADERGERIEVALIATRGGRRWQLPKGSREADESSLQTAIREVHEEVGLQTESEGFLQTIDYWYWDTYRKEVAELVHKSVDFYLLRVVGGVLSDDSYEVDAVGWFGLERAVELLTFEGEREVLQAAQAKLMAES